MDLADDLGAGAVAAASASDPAEDGAESNSEPLLLSPVEAAALLLALPPPPTELEDPCFEFDSPAFLVQLGFDSRLGSRLSAIGSANQLLTSE